MKALVLEEPELEFGQGGRHVDPRTGLLYYGPADTGTETAPGRIRVGLVGDPEGVDGVRSWLQRCREPIEGKESHLKNLFPAWPGFALDGPFAAELVFDDGLERLILARQLRRLVKMDRDLATREAVDLFIAQIESLVETGRVDLVICARPPDLLDQVTEESEERAGAERAPAERAVDFHDLLKARAMRFRTPIQIVRPTTWDPKRARTQVHNRQRLRQVEDAASRAWNLHAALYYKAGGVPWRLRRQSSDLAVCFVGVSFFQALDQATLHTSVAQVFNERGDGVIVRGEQATISKDDRQPHLSSADSQSLLVAALARYRAEHHTHPARVVLHKSSVFSPAEVEGFMAAAEAERLESLELFWISRSGSARLFRNNNLPPLRGTALFFDQRRQLLYTRGSVPYYATYPGMYVPHPITVDAQLAERSPAQIADEVLALTKLNWNQTRLDGRDPITLRTADRVGDILRYAQPEEPVAARYAHYM